MRRYAPQEYGEYLDTQRRRSDKKWPSSTFWNNIEDFKDHAGAIWHHCKPSKVLCLGIRNGNEYVAFQERPQFEGCEIWGVDINPKVTKVGPLCYCLDFNELPKKWRNRFDVVYSNSLDHSFDIEKTLGSWRSVVRPDGYLALVLSTDVVTNTDLYGFEMADLEHLFPADQYEIVWQKELLTCINVIVKVKKPLC